VDWDGVLHEGAVALALPWHRALEPLGGLLEIRADAQRGAIVALDAVELAHARKLQRLEREAQLREGPPQPCRIQQNVGPAIEARAGGFIDEPLGQAAQRTGGLTEGHLVPCLTKGQCGGQAPRAAADDHRARHGAAFGGRPKPNSTRSARRTTASSSPSGARSGKACASIWGSHQPPRSPPQE
jgi:hypothetical protein